MNKVQDAPWIREVERRGVPETIELLCPICGKEAESYFIDRKTNDVIGCDECIMMTDAFEWFEEHKEENE